MRYLKQLSFVEKVFPDATHTRFTHALGVSFLSGQFAKKLNLSESEVRLVQAAGLLHDVGHLPFSHSLDIFIPKLFNGKNIYTHEDLGRAIVAGKIKLDLPDAGKIPSILEKYKLNPEDVGSLIAKQFTLKPYLQKIISGGVDADRLDFLKRDSMNTGVVSGNVDQERILQLALINNNNLEFHHKAISPVREMLNARNVMYNEVYIHRTVNLSETMLQKAVELEIDNLPDLPKMGDEELLMRLEQSKNEKVKELAQRIKYRKLYKIAYQIPMHSATEKIKENIEALKKKGTKRIESELIGLINKKRKILNNNEEIRNGDVLASFPNVEKIKYQKIFDKQEINVFSPGKKNTNYSYFNVICEKSLKAEAEYAVKEYLENI
ncbi:HD domain-containing protein [Candidatus Woesearchaeota archaeon]|nr:HD domain-containing protein [Candidatus Woesearchaeota archaeon]